MADSPETNLTADSTEPVSAPVVAQKIVVTAPVGNVAKAEEEVQEIDPAILSLKKSDPFNRQSDPAPGGTALLDEFSGIGGEFRINDETGKRERVAD